MGGCPVQRDANQSERSGPRGGMTLARHMPRHRRCSGAWGSGANASEQEDDVDYRLRNVGMRVLLAGLLFGSAIAAAHADDYPNRPVTIVIPPAVRPIPRRAPSPTCC